MYIYQLIVTCVDRSIVTQSIAPHHTTRQQAHRAAPHRGGGPAAFEPAGEQQRHIPFTRALGQPVLPALAPECVPTD